MSSIPELLKQLNTTIAQGFADLKAAQSGTVTPEHIQPVIDQLNTISPKIDAIEAQVADTPNT